MKPPPPPRPERRAPAAVLFDADGTLVGHDPAREGGFDGVREMLAHLRSAGFALGVVTGKERRTWPAAARGLALELFDVVVTDDERDAPGPDAAVLLAAAAALGRDPGEIVYVADSLDDLRAGRAAGMRTAAALWAKTAPGERESFLERARACAPDWVLDRPADLSRALAPWC